MRIGAFFSLVGSWFCFLGKERRFDAVANVWFMALTRSNGFNVIRVKERVPLCFRSE